MSKADEKKDKIEQDMRTDDEKEKEENEKEMINIVSQVDGVDQSDKQRLYNLLTENKDVFIKRAGSFVGVKCHLVTYEHVPFRERERPVPYKLRDAVKRNIQKLLE